MDNFDLYSQYYDLLYQDKDYEAEASYVKNVITKYKPSTKKILELGSGTGKHAFILADFGFEILGLERSQSMVDLAQQTQHANVHFKVADIKDFDLSTQFDVAISLFHVISYLTDTKSLLQTFQNVNHHLNDNGLFIFDVWHSPAVYANTPENRTKMLSNEKVNIIREAIPTIHDNENVVDVEYTIKITDLITQETKQFVEVHPMRHFSKPEMEILAAATGFEILGSEEFETETKPSKNTWGVCYIFKKSLNN